MPPLLRASPSTFDFSSPSGCTVASMKSGDFGGASVAGSEPEPSLPRPQPAATSAAIAAATRRTRRAFTGRRILARSSLDGDRLGQIAGLVDIEAASAGDGVGGTRPAQGAA